MDEDGVTRMVDRDSRGVMRVLDLEDAGGWDLWEEAKR
jgi:hypothetical protein